MSDSEKDDFNLFEKGKSWPQILVEVMKQRNHLQSVLLFEGEEAAREFHKKILEELGDEEELEAILDQAIEEEPDRREVINLTRENLHHLIDCLDPLKYRKRQLEKIINEFHLRMKAYEQGLSSKNLGNRIKWDDANMPQLLSDSNIFIALILAEEEMSEIHALARKALHIITEYEVVQNEASADLRSIH